jgi:hypothetical protein
MTISAVLDSDRNVKVPVGFYGSINPNDATLGAMSVGKRAASHTMMRTNVWLCALAVLFCFPELGNSDPLKFKFGVNLEERYSDNIFFDTSDPQDDLITQLGPWLQGGWKTEIIDFQLQGRLDYYDYRDNDDLDALDQSYKSHLFRQWTPRFSTSLSAAYLDDERRERDLAETGLLFNDDNRQRQTYSLDGHYQLSQLSTVSLTYSYQDEAFDDELTYDFQSHWVQLTSSSDLSSVVQRCSGNLILAGGVYTYKRDYDTMDPFLGIFPSRTNDEQFIEYYALRLGVKHDRTKRLRLNIDIGARYTRIKKTVSTTIAPNTLNLTVPTDEEEDESRGYVATVEVNYSGDTYQINVLASHDLVPASGRDGTVERTTLRFGGTGRIVNNWSYHWAARGYLNRSDNSRVTEDEDEVTVQLTGGLRYAFTRQWSLGAYWQTYWLDDRNNDIDKTQSTASLRLQWNWPILD